MSNFCGNPVLVKCFSMIKLSNYCLISLVSRWVENGGCAPGCSSNYSLNDPDFTVFPFQKTKQWEKMDSKYSQWQFEPSTICIKHFSCKFIVRENSATRPVGTVVSYVRKAPILTKDACISFNLWESASHIFQSLIQSTFTIFLREIKLTNGLKDIYNFF